MLFQSLLMTFSQRVRNPKVLCYVFVHRHQIFKSKMKAPSFSYANFGTTIKHRGKHPEFDDRYFVYDESRDMSYVKHEDNPEMPLVSLTVCLPDNKGKVIVKARVGNTVMKSIEKHNGENEQQIPMESACDGSKACTTCHVYCDKGDSDYFISPDLDEEDLLDTAPYLKSTSRLSCQMRILKPFDHMEIILPKGTVNFAFEQAAKKNSDAS